MIHLPRRFPLAQLPTPIEPFPLTPDPESDVAIFVKRDDLTGSVLSGNKVRKLEFLYYDLLASGAKAVITCGGVQSNHCRATAAIAARSGVECHLVLKGREPKTPAGNFFLSRLFGAKTRFISEKEYEANVDGIMHAMARRLNTRGKKAYVIPEGGSDPLGVWGYIKALQEIKAQAETANLDFDTIVTAVGSGGTFAGLYLGSKITGWNVKIMGFAVCRNTLHFQRRIFDLCLTVEKELGADLGLDPADIDIDDCFIGPGYARIGRTEADFIRDIAIHSGLVLDPAYTSKALLGLFTRIAERRFPPGSQVLFIHTGGIFGLLPMGKIATSE